MVGVGARLWVGLGVMIGVGVCCLGGGLVIGRADAKGGAVYRVRHKGSGGAAGNQTGPMACLQGIAEGSAQWWSRAC